MSNTHTNKTDNKPANEKAPVTDRNKPAKGDTVEDGEQKRPAA